MRHLTCGPLQVDELPYTEPIVDEVAETERRPLVRRLASSAPTMTEPAGGLSILYWPDGFGVPWGSPQQLEYHILHEEIFVLTGSIRFDGWYRVDARGYLNHPPFWVHPTNFWAEGELTMLMRTHTDPVVQFEQIPAGWDGTEFLATGKPSASRGVSALQLSDLKWSEVSDRSGRPTGLSARWIWDDDDDRWTSWLMTVPAGWTADASTMASSGGDEFFVLDGALQVSGPEPVRLDAYGYACQNDGPLFPDASAWTAPTGATFIRWTRGAEWGRRPAGPTIRLAGAGR